MTADDQNIRQLWRQMETSWAAGSGAGFAEPFADDADFVSVRGEVQSGRAEIAQRHGALFDGPYAGTTMTADVQAIRYLRPDLALVHVASTVTPSNGAPAVATHAQAVTERRDGTWRIAAFHNMVPVAPTGGR